MDLKYILDPDSTQQRSPASVAPREVPARLLLQEPLAREARAIPPFMDDGREYVFDFDNNLWVPPPPLEEESYPPSWPPSPTREESDPTNTPVGFWDRLGPQSDARFMDMPILGSESEGEHAPGDAPIHPRREGFYEKHFPHVNKAKMSISIPGTLAPMGRTPRPGAGTTLLPSTAWGPPQPGDEDVRPVRGAPIGYDHEAEAREVRAGAKILVDMIREKQQADEDAKNKEESGSTRVYKDERFEADHLLTREDKETKYVLLQDLIENAEYYQAHYTFGGFYFVDRDTVEWLLTDEHWNDLTGEASGGESESEDENPDDEEVNSDDEDEDHDPDERPLRAQLIGAALSSAIARAQIASMEDCGGSHLDMIMRPASFQDFVRSVGPLPEGGVPTFNGGEH